MCEPPFLVAPLSFAVKAEQSRFPAAELETIFFKVGPR